MEITIILLTALLPVAMLLLYIYRKDKKSPEPTSQLVKAFLLGVLAAPLSLCLSYPLMFLSELLLGSEGLVGVLSSAFLGAAIPEELAKLFILWLFLRKNKYFDESMDGIVYAVCVSMGFAALENIQYLFTYSDEFLSVGVQRAIFSVPGHCCFAIIMGYFYSLAKFYPKDPKTNKSMVVVAPIIAHGAYDTILMLGSIAPAISGILMIVFLFFCYKLWKFASKKISEHLQRDSELPNKD